MRALVPSKAANHEWSIDSASKLETEPNEWTLESYALLVTHKVGTTGNIPATNVLIKGCPSKHITLEKEQKVRLRALVPSNATHHEWSIDSASKLETEPNEWTFESYALVVTYKGGILGNIPGTNGSIKACGLTKHPPLKEEKKVWWWEHFFLQKPHSSDGLTESKLEAEQN